ncbi:hypothetical protein RV15_GL002959 [Enterococcus silesiacus]|uniref:Uncharacterized protein n=1 Tax=Enterococcus silesiacus TaxID=332949 RepID=A0AA91GBU2_9ENTE|nr:hypothetical protein RV15_GL002959 [Enterococcus silesiacus]
MIFFDPNLIYTDVKQAHLSDNKDTPKINKKDAEYSIQASFLLAN